MLVFTDPVGAMGPRPVPTVGRTERTEGHIGPIGWVGWIDGRIRWDASDGRIGRIGQTAVNLHSSATRNSFRLMCACAGSLVALLAQGQNLIELASHVDFPREPCPSPLGLSRSKCEQVEQKKQSEAK